MEAQLVEDTWLGSYTAGESSSHTGNKKQHWASGWRVSFPNSTPLLSAPPWGPVATAKSKRVIRVMQGGASAGQEDTHSLKHTHKLKPGMCLS